MGDMSLFEIGILVMIGVGFFALIMYAALYARSKDEDTR